MTKSLPPKSLVLYADDDTDDQELIREAFDEFSSFIELVTFENGAQLLHYIERLARLQPKPCLIILDINMPVMDGKQTLKKLRGLAECKEVPVVLFTTSTLPAEADYARHHDAGFVTKPLHTRQLHLIVSQLTEHCTDSLKEKIKKQRDR